MADRVVVGMNENAPEWVDRRMDLMATYMGSDHADPAEVVNEHRSEAAGCSVGRTRSDVHESLARSCHIQYSRSPHNSVAFDWCDREGRGRSCRYSAEADRKTSRSR